MMGSRSVLVLGTALVFSASAFAGTGPARPDASDSLHQLRDTLHQLDVATPIQGVLEVQSQGTKGKGDSAKKHAARLHLEISAQKDLTVKYPAALLHKVAAERKAHAADASHAMPTAALLGQIQESDVEKTVSIAPALLRMLANAQSSVVKPARLHGKPTRKLSVTLPQPKSDGNSLAEAKDYSGSASIWMDADGTPLAYSTLFKGKFCKFLLCLTVDQSQSGALRIVNGRLVAVKRTVDNKQSGLGMDSQSRTIFTFRVTPSEAPGNP